jgi:hypothetical protein
MRERPMRACGRDRGRCRASQREKRRFGKRATLAIYDERDSRNSSWLFLQKEIDNLLEACFTPNYSNGTIQYGMTSFLELLLHMCLVAHNTVHMDYYIYMCFNPDKGDMLLGQEPCPRRPKLSPPSDLLFNGPDLLNQILPESASSAFTYHLQLLFCLYLALV